MQGAVSSGPLPWHHYLQARMCEWGCVRALSMWRLKRLPHFFRQQWNEQLQELGVSTCVCLHKIYLYLTFRYLDRTNIMTNKNWLHTIGSHCIPLDKLFESKEALKVWLSRFHICFSSLTIKKRHSELYLLKHYAVGGTQCSELNCFHHLKKINVTVPLLAKRNCLLLLCAFW